MKSNKKKDLNCLFKNPQPEDYLKNLYHYNKLLEKTDAIKQQKIFFYLTKKGKEKKVIGELLSNLPLSVLKANREDIALDKELLIPLIEIDYERFVQIFWDKYYLIDYELIFRFFMKNIEGLRGKIKIKAFLMFLKYSAIEYARDKKMGYTRVNFGLLFKPEYKLLFFKTMIDVYVQCNKQEKEILLKFLISLKDFIYVYSDIIFKAINLLMKKNLELYALGKINNFTNSQYNPFLFILSTAVWKEFKDVNQKKLTIEFLRHGIGVKEIFTQYPAEKTINQEFEVLYSILCLNKGYIIENKKNILNFVVKKLIEKYKNEEPLIAQNYDYDFEEIIPNFKIFLNNFWKKEVETFFGLYNKEISKTLERENVNPYSLLTNL